MTTKAFDGRRTRIVATLGPASDSPAVLERLIDAGLDVARFNFSHGSYDAHQKRLDLLRDLANKAGRAVAAMADLQGPKIRTGRFPDGPVTLEPGQKFTITARDVPGSKTIVSNTWPELPRAVNPGDPVLLCDGLLRLKVEKVEGDDVHCVVEVGGEVSDNKGINLPGTTGRGVALTDKDRKDLEYILEAGFDFVALSFVTRPEDILELRELCSKAKNPPLLVAKIEKPKAVEVFDKILEVVDVVMVARGDLGVEAAPEKVPTIQKRIIRACVEAGKPVITATEMLESMTTNARPTRAEASDVANAIEDGTDAVMLSGESAKGKYPVEAVQMMARIAREVDPTLAATGGAKFHEDRSCCVDESVSHAAASIAATIGAKLIVAYTVSGSTARRIAKYRPATPLIAISPAAETCRKLAMTWGVRALEGPSVSNLDALPAAVDRLCAAYGLAQKGDTVVITVGAPLDVPGTTNTLRVHIIGGA